MTDLPMPGMPLVETLEPGVQRWTFTSDDPAERRAAFTYWRGWFGLEEGDEPFDQNGRIWLVRGPTVE